MLDQFSEEEAAAIKSVPAAPLSKEVEHYYGDLFAQRSKDVSLSLGAEGESNTDALASLELAIAKKRAKSRRERRLERKQERRRSYALREARLSNITERYTQEIEALEELPPAGASDAPLSPGAAVWPGELESVSPITSLRCSLPRIESATMSLDQMALCEAASHPSAEETPQPCSRAEPSVETGKPLDAKPDAEGPQAVAAKPFAVGDRVEVDFDDEGWFKGVVESLQPREGAYVYQVKLDDGEFADSVTGSEIRSEKHEDHAECTSTVVAHTRSDALSGFDSISEARSDCFSDGLPDEDLRMSCRVTDRGVDWSFIEEDRVTWSRPTLSSVKAHDDRYPRWEAAKLGVNT